MPWQSDDLLGFYVCPACKRGLDKRDNSLGCTRCNRAYAVIGGIPDFLNPIMEQDAGSLVQQIERADRGYLKWLSGIYESRFWYPFVIRVYLGKNTTSFSELVRKIQSAVNVDRGRILDAACGPATFGRRAASPDRAVFGIDLSMAMLQKGCEYIAREGISNIHLSRTKVECLPFCDQFFDFAICSGALHLFSDPAAALREIGRTLKPGARLVGLTFINGTGGLLQFPWFRERLRQRGVVHVFEVPELEDDLAQAGFEHFQPQLMGSGIFFSADRACPA